MRLQGENPESSTQARNEEGDPNVGKTVGRTPLWLAPTLEPFEVRRISEPSCCCGSLPLGFQDKQRSGEHDDCDRELNFVDELQTSTASRVRPSHDASCPAKTMPRPIPDPAGRQQCRHALAWNALVHRLQVLGPDDCSSRTQRRALRVRLRVGECGSGKWCC